MWPTFFTLPRSPEHDGGGEKIHQKEGGEKKKRKARPKQVSAFPCRYFGLGAKKGEEGEKGGERGPCPLDATRRQGSGKKLGEGGEEKKGIEKARGDLACHCGCSAVIATEGEKIKKKEGKKRKRRQWENRSSFALPGSSR